MSFNGRGLRAAMGVRKDPEGVSESGGTWLIQWTNPDGTRTERTTPQGQVDIFDACRVTANLYRCSVYFTPGDKHGRPIRAQDDGHILWTRVDPGDGHALDIVLDQTTKGATAP